MHPRLIAAIYAAAVFLSATLLFTAQLSFTKALLPLLGGTPAVWNTAMLFFQSVLLAGYAYAHGLSRMLAPRAQVKAHVSLLALSLLAIPISGLAGRTPPPGASPVAWLIGVLLVTLGPTLFLLSATSPLIQAWFRHTGHERASDPYFLYAPSNLGSMIAVLGYPFLIEPFFTLRQQHAGWAVGYVLFGGVIAASGGLIWRARAAPADVMVATDPADGSAPVGTETGGVLTGDEPAVERAPATSAPGTTDRIWWVMLAAVPSSLVLGATSYISTDVAAFPLLWVIPLSLYLLSFVLTFARRPLIPMGISWTVQLVVIAMWMSTWFLRIAAPAWWRFALQLVLLFATAMVCHGELVRRRPAARYLTQFYLLLALGGALGAAFNALVAPTVFSDVVEYPLAIMVACLLRPVLLDIRLTRLGYALELALAAALAGLAAAVAFWPPMASKISAVNGPLLLTLLVLPVMVAGVRSPRRLALLITILWVAGTKSREYGGAILLRERSFFGVYEVRSTPRGTQHSLVHGTTLHGSQWREPEDRRTTPTSYYTSIGPLGQLFIAHEGFADTARIGVIGLGAGTVACYAKPTQPWTFFELDPLVERIARDTSYFTYVSQCAPHARVVHGDARISLRAEQDHSYDLLIMDAFSSDAVPVHLLTREALAMYLQKLAPRGLIAFHISNRYVDVEPVLAVLAREAGLVALNQGWQPPGTDAAYWLVNPSRWLVIGRDSAAFGPLTDDHRWEPPRLRADVEPWTDEFSSVPRVMIWRSRFAG
ncbi:MAG TPA: fused MFS/spermidine synthase [Gemmatimonadaceae bacterium]